MKKRKQSELWYNAYDKEVGGIRLESREAVLRYGWGCLDTRTGLWMKGRQSGVPTVIL